MSQTPQTLRERLLQSAVDQLEEIRLTIGPKLMLRAISKESYIGDNHSKQTEQLQPPTRLTKQEILTLAYAAVALFASGFLN